MGLKSCDGVIEQSLIDGARAKSDEDGPNPILGLGPSQSTLPPGSADHCNAPVSCRSGRKVIVGNV